MKNPCGTTKANILEQVRINAVPVYWGTGVNPVNSPAQFFVAWGEGILSGGLIRTFNADTFEQGFLWFVDEDEAEAKYVEIQANLCQIEAR
ncbi:MAG: hypothetical protein QMC95_12915 [Desulfitobacteriaceae bacterium]|nr:hypothetical protein [Desulfitobacteriaceae bacterium]MDI6880403.1 hypothetical protein [Desulfitobacteriaceae bacterium]MDI6915100.1 hypothetical protein [Desulfitobacteriaceae bacterium]